MFWPEIQLYPYRSRQSEMTWPEKGAAVPLSKPSVGGMLVKKSTVVPLSQPSVRNMLARKRYSIPIVAVSQKYFGRKEVRHPYRSRQSEICWPKKGIVPQLYTSPNNGWKKNVPNHRKGTPKNAKIPMTPSRPSPRSSYISTGITPGRNTEIHQSANTLTQATFVRTVAISSSFVS